MARSIINLLDKDSGVFPFEVDTITLGGVTRYRMVGVSDEPVWDPVTPSAQLAVAATSSGEYITVTNATTVDLMLIVPGVPAGEGATPLADMLRLYVSKLGGDLIWSHSYDPGATLTHSNIITADGYYDFGDISRLTHLYVRAQTATSAILVMNWGKK